MKDPQIFVVTVEFEDGTTVERPSMHWSAIPSALQNILMDTEHDDNDIKLVSIWPDLFSGTPAEFLLQQRTMHEQEIALGTYFNLDTPAVFNPQS